TDRTTCGTGLISNRASFVTSNDGSGASSPAGTTTDITVNCATIGLTKTADHTSINAGDDVGYTIKATNNGAGDAHGFTITDVVPANAGLSWSVDSQTPAAPACTISTTSPITLTCGPTDL